MSESSGTGPLLQLMASGLQLWIRSQCDSVGELKLELHGSALELFRGRLAGVSLKARDVSFQGLPLHHAELTSGPLKLNVNLSKPGQAVQLKQAFEIQGNVTLTGNALNKALLSDPWSWLGDWLAEQLMGLTPLGGLRINNDILELQAAVIGQLEPAKSQFLLRADSGTILIRHLDADAEAEASLPMDPGIVIKKAELKGGQLHLKGDATVKP
ncbi:MAG: DUF2993 domain-containing protein [Prochlorococcus sp.]|nr:DUF2993 domain-containing protein [Prochlorococcus sp.]MDP6194017.1 DUF2993 domain-containing protein [Prochlorococcaceae cyanobacterium ETNP18_MAG_1]